MLFFFVFFLIFYISKYKTQNQLGIFHLFYETKMNLFLLWRMQSLTFTTLPTYKNLVTRLSEQSGAQEKRC